MVKEVSRNNRAKPQEANIFLSEQNISIRGKKKPKPEEILLLRSNSNLLHELYYRPPANNKYHFLDTILIKYHPRSAHPRKEKFINRNVQDNNL